MNELRHERERRGWSLEDVADRTRIPRPYLEALEDGNHDVLPPGPFFRGYLRQYLEFLGEDMEQTEGPSPDVLDQQIAGKVESGLDEGLVRAVGSRIDHVPHPLSFDKLGTFSLTGDEDHGVDVLRFEVLV